MLDLTLKASQNTQDGFTLKVKANTADDVKTAKEISEAVIAKIEKIVINIDSNNDY